MLTITRLTDEGKNKDGARVFEYLKATEYYIGKDGETISSSQWLGGGAKVLGLDGDVDIATMDKLAHGYGPDGSPLKQNAGEGSRVGWDLTFSAEKDFSVLYAAAGDDERERLLDAHHRAVEDAMGYLEDMTAVRTGKGGNGPRLRTTGFVASRHTHFANRELEPQIHSHVVAYNVAQGTDGKWRSLDTNEVGLNIRTAGALYRAQMAHNLQELGYGIEKKRAIDEDGREKGDVFYRIVGVDDEMRESFSTRRQQILDYMEEHGVGSQLACLATRKNKDEPTYAELQDMWKQTMDGLEKDQNITLKPDDIKGRDNKLDDWTDYDVTRRLHVHDAVFSRSQLIERVALEKVGDGDIKSILKEADEVMKREGYIQTQDPQAKYRMGPDQQTFTSEGMLRKEREVAQRGMDRMDDESVRSKEEVRDKVMAEFQERNGFQLTDEQKAGISHLTSGTGGTAIMSGRAGTGKTTISEVCVEIWHAEGREVIGTSTGWDATKKLEAEAKIPSFSAEKLIYELDGGKRTLSRGSILLYDEAGMAGTETIHKLQAHTDKAGAKLVLMGDAQQLQPVAAGNPFALMTQRIGDAELTEIRRQKDDDDRVTANLHYSATDGAEIISRLDEQGQLRRVESRPDAYKEIAKDYINSDREEREKLVIGGTRNEVSQLNKAIREERQEKGLLAKDGHMMDTIAGGDKQRIEVAEGDRIRFGKLDKDLNLYNGLQGRVLGIIPGKEEGSFRIRAVTESDIKANDGREVEWDTADYKHFTHGYAMTVHKSQGQGRKEVFHLANPQMTDKHLQLVAFTRSKEGYKMYALNDDIQDLEKRASKERLKVNAIDLVKDEQPPQTAREKWQERTAAKRQTPENPEDAKHRQEAADRLRRMVEDQRKAQQQQKPAERTANSDDATRNAYKERLTPAASPALTEEQKRQRALSPR